jgi:hypothetical protein
MTVDIDEVKLNRNEFGLWAGWTLATTAGMLLGFLPILLFIDSLPLWLLRILIPLWSGFLVGLFQWLALRGYLTNSVDWVLNGGAGWALGFALGLVIIQALSGSFLGAVLGYILFGIIIGILQWPVLRREIPSAAIWVIASVVGWALGALLSQLVLNALVMGDVISQALSTAVTAGVTGLVAGAITGIALVLIARQPEV